MYSACGGQKRVLELLELKLQVVVSCRVCVLGIELKSSERAVGSLITEPSLQPGSHCAPSSHCGALRETYWEKAVLYH